MWSLLDGIYIPKGAHGAHVEPVWKEIRPMNAQGAHVEPWGGDNKSAPKRSQGRYWGPMGPWAFFVLLRCAGTT